MHVPKPILQAPDPAEAARGLRGIGTYYILDALWDEVVGDGVDVEQLASAFAGEISPPPAVLHRRETEPLVEPMWRSLEDGGVVERMVEDLGRPATCWPFIIPNSWDLMGSTWARVYATALQNFQTKIISDWSRPTAWVHGWAKSMTLQHIAPSPQVTHRQAKDVWSKFWSCQYPQSLTDIVYTALWGKPKVQHRIQPISHTDKCPLCRIKKEYVSHALRYCKFYPYVYVWLSKALGLDTATWRLGALEATKTVDSLLLWVARKAHWWTRCKAHVRHTPSMSTFLFAWIDNIQVLLQWQPLEHLIKPLLQFRHFVQEYNETEVLPAPEL